MTIRYFFYKGLRSEIDNKQSRCDNHSINISHEMIIYYQVHEAPSNQLLLQNITASLPVDINPNSLEAIAPISLVDFN